MMKRTYMTCGIILFMMMFIAGPALQAQSRNIDAQTQKELDAINAYIDSKLMESPVNTEKDSAGEKKYEGLEEAAMDYLGKISGQEDRKHFFMNGNKVATEIYNFGQVAPGLGLLRNINNTVWNNLGYVFAFCPFVGASVPDNDDPTKRHYIITDGLMDYTSPLLREVSPDGDTLWQWQPLPGYADPDQDLMASNPAPDTDFDGKPDSWPRSWYNPALGEYVWPGYLSQNVASADLEVFWAMDDRDNREFNYFPYNDDPNKKGIGVQVDCRAFQWSNSLAENTIFFVYTITNVSDKDLDTVLFGIYGDPDIGGGSPENTDDRGFFIPPYDSAGRYDNIPVYSRSLVYFWDTDMKGDFGRKLGLMGCKFLESPGNPDDGIDNDGDGMIDERQDDGIDNDSDWVAAVHDIGVDGVPNTGDEGEGDGIPTRGRKLADGSLDPLHPGEPNFELTDLDEADQIGLTSFNSWRWSDDKISNDLSMWNRCLPRNFGQITQEQDIVFVFGSGYISLKAGETKRISMALLFGEDRDDLLISAKTVQTIYNNNYQFFRPPNLPTLHAVPGDKKVTLYWDDLAEQSKDPITGYDFEGYVIYRSTDPNFGDVQVITDGKGSSFLSEPLKQIDGSECKWDIAYIEEPYTDVNNNGKWDVGEPFQDVNKNGVHNKQIDSPWKGYHPVPYQDRGVQYYMGDNEGIVHTYVDSNEVINGQTYYYALVAYDHGDSVGIPVTETTKKITTDPITNELTFDENTVMVIPGPRASGYVEPELGQNDLVHVGGRGTGSISFEILDDRKIEEGRKYQVTFKQGYEELGKQIDALNYSVKNMEVFEQNIQLYDTLFAAIMFENIVEDEALKVMNESGTTVYRPDIDYVLDAQRGSVRRTSYGNIPENAVIKVQYRYYPVHESTAMANDDTNPVFEGIKLRMNNPEKLAYDPERSQWLEGNSNYKFNAGLTTFFLKKHLVPADYQVTFSSTAIDTALILDDSGLPKVIPINIKVEDITTGVPKPIFTFISEGTGDLRNEWWDPGEEIVLFKYGSTGASTDTITWGINVMPDYDVVPNHILNHLDEVNAYMDSTGYDIDSLKQVKAELEEERDSYLVPPTDGDILFIASQRPFDTTDVFTFETAAGYVRTDMPENSLDDIYVVPNPYVGYNELEPTNKLPGKTRGERRIYFENLPPTCSIRIFTLTGELVKEIHREGGVDNGREFWNLLSKDGFTVAYGVYVAHIDAPGIGEKLLKFALIK